MRSGGVYLALLKGLSLFYEVLSYITIQLLIDLLHVGAGSYRGDNHVACAEAQEEEQKG